jgi:hypothetical protein
VINQSILQPIDTILMAAIGPTQTEVRSTIAQFHPHQPQYAQARGRLRHFLHPNGKRVHIASDPAEAGQIQQRLTAVSGLHKFEVFVSGTPQHLNAVRDTQLHHENRRELLRREHRHVWEQFEGVHMDLNTLSDEWARIMDRGVSLDAHFDRFGYSAHIKSYEGETPGETAPIRSRRASETSSTRSTGNQHATPLHLFKVPVVKQYFHKGILWRASSLREVQSFELFIDLLYVGIIAVNGDAVAENPTGISLLRFIITFTLGWKVRKRHRTESSVKESNISHRSGPIWQ